MHNTLQLVFDRVGIKCPSIFVAGGAAVWFDGASDIDIWFGHSRHDLAHNFLYHFPVRVEVSEEYAGMDMKGIGFDPAIGKPVQVLVTDAKNPEEVINDFDISTHQWAIDGFGVLTAGGKSTDTKFPPQILHTKKPQKTLERYVKICHRYGHTPDMAEMMKLNSTMELMKVTGPKTQATEVTTQAKPDLSWTWSDIKLENVSWSIDTTGASAGSFVFFNTNDKTK